MSEPPAAVVPPSATSTTYQVQPPSPDLQTCPNGYGTLRDSGLPPDFQKKQHCASQSFLYSMGDEADDILRSFNLTEAEHAEYAVVKECFSSHFVWGNVMWFLRGLNLICASRRKGRHQGKSDKEPNPRTLWSLNGNYSVSWRIVVWPRCCTPPEAAQWWE